MQLRKLAFVPSEEISPQIWALLAVVVAVVGAYFMVIPMLVVRMVRAMNLTPFQMGIAVSLWIFIVKGFAFFGAMAAGRMGMRRAFFWGLLARAFGIVWLDYTQSFSLLLLALAISAAGEALFIPPMRALILHLTTDENRRRVISYQQVGYNLGQILGPALGGLVFLLGSRHGFLINGVIYLLSAIFAAATIGLRDRAAQEKTSEPLPTLLRRAGKDHRFLFFAILTGSFFFMLTQTRLLIPFKIFSLFSDLSVSAQNEMVAFVLLVNACVILLAQIFVMPYLRRLSPQFIFQLGLVNAGLGLFIAGTATNYPIFFVGIVIYGSGLVLVLPSIGLNIADRGVTGSMILVYYALTDIAWALGGSAGNMWGAYVKTHLPVDSFFPWFLFLVVGGVSAILVSVLVVDRKKTGH